ncbi:alpha/beta hydrolase [uncultured Pseudosulfitobacter sp.]|uniref:alpha/beta hydrolase n=1 Tax=uncultured Pseudosulfitobacter sp. TaxID=2854214 RepID=UPI0030DA08C5
MPVLRVNAAPDGPCLHLTHAPLRPALITAARGTGPIIVMIHGYSYNPDLPDHCPHRTLLRRDGAWLRQMGFGMGDPDEGLALGFGWNARGSVWKAARRARVAGGQLGRVLRILHHAAPHRPIHLMTHSMGAEVAMAALHVLPRGAVARLLTLTPATYRSTADDALRAPAGRALEWINVASRENALFDLIYERLVAPPRRRDRVIGARLHAANATTLRLDCPRTLERLQRFGAQIAPPTARICHWSGYTRPGALGFYNRLLRDPARVPLSALQAPLPSAPARWRLSLPGWQKAAT